MNDPRDMPPPFPGGSRGPGGSESQGRDAGGYGERGWSSDRPDGSSRSQGPYAGPFSGTGYGPGYGTGRDGGNPFRSPNPHRLYRNRREGKVAGVCAGIADYVNVDPWMVRLGVVFGFFFFPPVFLIGYLVLWFILKERPSALYENREEEQFWRSVSTRPDQTLSGLKVKFRELDRSIAGMEGFVASREFDLHRQFRDLEKK